MSDTAARSAGPESLRPAMMTAAVLRGRSDLRIETVPTPSARRGELLLEITAVGVCGTDASEWAHGPKHFPLPLVTRSPATPAR